MALVIPGRLVVLGLLAACVLVATPMSARGEGSTCGDFASLLSTSIHMTNADAGLLRVASSGLSGIARTDKLRSAVRQAVGIYEGLLNAASRGRSRTDTDPTIRAAWKSLATGLTLRIDAYSILLRALAAGATTSAQTSAYGHASARIRANNERWSPIAAALNKLYHGC